MALAATIRREMMRVQPEFRVSNIRTQAELNQSQTVRERLLAMLAVFFAGVAVLLAGIGLYGVLDYSVLQRRREFGIRMAIGAPILDIARRVTDDVFLMVFVGCGMGAASGLFLERYVRSLLYEVKPFDFAVLTLPTLVIIAAATLAAIPAIVRAIRIDAATMLRAD